MLHIREIPSVRSPETLWLGVEDILKCNVKLDSYRYCRKSAMLQVHNAFMGEMIRQTIGPNHPIKNLVKVLFLL